MRLMSAAASDFPRRFDAALALRGLDNIAAAQLLGVSTATVSRLRNGRTTPSRTVGLLIKEKFGDQTWAFLAGKRDSLPIVTT